jgi:GNAT superfamily N-acetyltransferase
MEAEFALAGRESIEELLDMRLEFLLGLESHGEPLDPAALRDANRVFLEEAMGRGAYAGFLCRVDGRPVACVGLLLYSLPPLRDPAPRKVAHVLNVYTQPAFRGRGYATRLMELAIAWAREAGCARLFLNATREGEGLYRRLGFDEQKDKALILPLR